MSDIRDYEDELIGQAYSELLCDAYEWGTCYPIVDGQLMITGIYDGTNGSDDYVLADVEDGHIVRIGSDQATDVAIARDLAESLGWHDPADDESDG